MFLVATAPGAPLELPGADYSPGKWTIQAG